MFRDDNLSAPADHASTGTNPRLSGHFKCHPMCEVNLGHQGAPARERKGHEATRRSSFIWNLLFPRTWHGLHNSRQHNPVNSGATRTQQLEDENCVSILPVSEGKVSCLSCEHYLSSEFCLRAFAVRRLFIFHSSLGFLSTTGHSSRATLSFLRLIHSSSIRLHIWMCSKVVQQSQ